MFLIPNNLTKRYIINIDDASHFFYSYVECKWCQHCMWYLSVKSEFRALIPICIWCETAFNGWNDPVTAEDKLLLLKHEYNWADDKTKTEIMAKLLGGHDKR